MRALPTGRPPLTKCLSSSAQADFACLLNAESDKREAILSRDGVLVQRAISGDGKAFGELMKDNTRRLHALGMSFFKNEADTDDFVQDVFIKAYTHLSSFRGGSAFSTWLIRIGYNTAINSLKRRKEYQSLADIDVPSAEDTPEESEVRRAAREAVREAARELPSAYKVCIDMYFFYGMQYKEISEVTLFPVGTIKSHIFRAKKLLKEKLEGLI